MRTIVNVSLVSDGDGNEFFSNPVTTVVRDKQPCFIPYCYCCCTGCGRCACCGCCGNCGCCGRCCGTFVRNCCGLCGVSSCRNAKAYFCCGSCVIIPD